MRSAFVQTDNPNPHVRRGREIIKRHPDVRRYFKPYPLSGAYITAIVALQLGIAYALRDAHWGWVILAAYLVGAFASHALFVLIHDATHDLITRRRLPNRLFGILCNVGQGFPSAMSFRTYHLLHHFHLDEYDYDADLAFDWEARLVGTSPVRKAVWLFLFAAVEVVRPLRIKRPFTDAWVLANTAVIVITDLLIWRVGGASGLAYVLLSTAVGVGLHPVGARWIQEHYTFHEGQETYSYYGILNAIQFNIGYHNEHHDLAKVPWIDLPKVRAMAPEFYDHLHHHRSWTRVLLQFLFDPKIDLFARITRGRAPHQANREAAVA
ncbi:MAG: fatty acid desaturase [Candidatus Binatia bacterium]